jgi:hypothetical protein
MGDWGFLIDDLRFGKMNLPQVWSLREVLLRYFFTFSATLYFTILRINS